MNPLKSLQSSISPIVLKELRQAVRGRFIPVLLCMYLIIQVLVMMGYSSDVGSVNFGTQLLLGYLTVFGGVVLVLVPCTVGLRHCLERNNEQMDLLYISALPPKQIVIGKFLAGMINNLLFFFASLPFISLTLLLRGVDVQTIVILTGSLLLAAPLALQAAITAASIPMSRVLQVIVGLAGLWALFMYLIIVLGILHNGMRTNILGSGLSGLFDARVLVALGLVGIFTFLCQAVGTALIQPSSANRAKPIRQTASFGWCLFLGAALMDDMDSLEIWAVFTSIFLLMCAAFMACERTHINPRLRNEIPQKFHFRIWHFIMSSGQANAMVWLLLHAIPTLYVATLFRDRNVTYGVTALTLAAVGYGFWGVFLYRLFFYRVIPKGKAFFVPLLLFVLGCGLPMLIGLLIEPTAGWREFAYLHVFNPMVSFKTSSWQGAIVTCLGILAAIGVLLNIPTILATIRDYRAPRKMDVHP